MKKILLFISFLLIPSFAFATSGACSYHSGVNCNSSSNGKAVCNDGSVSSVNFSDMKECKITTSTCYYPTAVSCMNESDFSQVQQQVDSMRGSQRAMNARNGLLGSPMDNSATVGQDKLDMCRNSINLYNTQINSYNQCVKNNNDQLQQQSTLSQAQADMTLQKICDSKNGVNSHYVGTSVTDPCVCNSGYILEPQTGLCLTPDLVALINPKPTPSEIITSAPVVTPAPIVVTHLFSNTLKVGSKNDAIINLQQLLIDKGFLKINKTTNYFGPSTSQALKKFQKASGLKQSGWLDQATIDFINNNS